MSVAADFLSGKVSNGLILAGMVSSIVSLMIHNGKEYIISAVLSVFLCFLVLYPIYKIGAIGAGDIKVLGIVASYFQPKEMLYVIGVSFVVGAFLSVLKLSAERNWKSRWNYLISYINQVISSRRFLLYEQSREQDSGYWQNKIHFTVAILISVLIKVGGIL